MEGRRLGWFQDAEVNMAAYPGARMIGSAAHCLIFVVCALVPGADVCTVRLGEHSLTVEPEHNLRSEGDVAVAVVEIAGNCGRARNARAVGWKQSCMMRNDGRRW